MSSQAGERLPAERELCEQFHVARTSVREAIQGLVSLGYLERRGNRPYVAERLPEVDLTQDGRKRMVSELFETRRVIELQLAELACYRATPEQRERISELASSFTPDLPLDEFRDLDRAFHSAMADACGNSLLNELYRKVLRLAVRVRGLRLAPVRPDEPQGGVRAGRELGPTAPGDRARRSSPAIPLPWSPRPRCTSRTWRSGCSAGLV